MGAGVRRVCCLGLSGWLSLFGYGLMSIFTIIQLRSFEVFGSCQVWSQNFISGTLKKLSFSVLLEFP